MTSESAALRAGPAGDLVGTLIRNSKVTAGEKKGDWTKVTVEGWLRDSELSATKSVVKSVTAAASLEAAGFELEAVDKAQTGSKDQIFLKIKVRNKTQQLISEWSATLIIQDAAGNVVVKTPVQNGKDALKPLSETDVNYSWSSGENPYATLSSYIQDQGKLRVSLTDIRISR